MVRTALLPGVLFAFVMALPAAAPAAEAEQSAEAVKAAQVFESLYGADVKRVAKTRDAKDDIDLAKRLLDTARRDAANKPALVAVLCEKAAGLAGSHADGAATAVEAMEFLLLQVPAKAGACTERVVEIREGQYNRARGAARTEAGESLIDALLGLVDVKLDAGDPSGAAVACRRAQAIGRAVKSERCDRIDARLKEMAGLMKTAREIENMKALIERNPENVAAREKLVRLLLVDLDDPAAAAKHLEGVKDASLRKYVPAAAKGVAAAPELACLELGEWYRGLGEAAAKNAKAAMFARAQAYYQRFLGLHTVDDLNRTAATVALKKVEAELARLGGAAASGTAAVPKDGVIKPGKWVDLLPFVDPAKDAVAGQWQKSSAGLAVAPGNCARAMLPVSVTGSYELECRFIRLPPDESSAAGAYNEVTFILPVGSSCVGCYLSMGGGGASALGPINGKSPSSNETTVRPGTLQDAHLYTVKARVVVNGDLCEVSVTLDGKPYLSWTGPWKSLSLASGWELPRPHVPAMGVNMAEAKAEAKPRALFGSARLRMLSGEARLLRPQGGAKATPAVAGGTIKPGKWTDLLPLVDPEKDKVKGDWRLRAKALAIVTPIRSGRITLPIAPEGDYELEVKFERTSGHNVVGIVLPVGSARAAVQMGGWHGDGWYYGGLGRINDKRAYANETTVKPGDLDNGREYVITIRVLAGRNHAQVAASLNGRPYVAWRGPEAALSLYKEWVLPQRGSLGLFAYESTVVFRSVRLKMLSGEARLLRPEGGTTAPSTAKPTPAAQAPTGPAIKPGKWIDLLKLVDPAKGVTKGSWKSKNGRLVIEPHRMGWAAVPCAPQGSYEMSVGFVRTGGNSEVVVILPVGSSAVALLLGQFHGSSSALRDAPGAAARVKPGTLVNGQEYQLDIRVLLKGLTAEIDIYLNGKPYIRWEGLQSSLRACYRLPNSSCIGLGADMSTVVFGSARLKMLSGEARLVSPRGE